MNATVTPLQRVRLHIENLRSQPELFHVTPERFAFVAKRHPELATRIDATFGWDSESLEQRLASADCLIAWRFDRANLDVRAPSLRWIHMTGAGIEHVLPLDWLPANVTLTNSRGAHADKAGEYAAMAVLALNTRMPFYATAKAERRWERIFVSSVTGKTAVIVGVGHMGAAAARRCKALGMVVIGVRASGASVEGVDRMVGPTQLAEVLPQADFLILTVPLTPQTRGLIGREALALLKPDCGLVNIARASVVDYAALFDALRHGRLSGAILDVFDPEPLPPEDLAWDVPNLLMTPHVSSDDAKWYSINVLELFFANLPRFLRCEPLANRVDPERGY